MRYFILLLFVSTYITAAAQQTPQYYIDKHPQGVGIPPYPNPLLAQPLEIQQSLLQADSFKNNPPYGRMKNIYLRTGYTWQPCNYYGINIELGYTAMTNLDTCTRLVTNLQRMAALDSLKIGDSVGDWIQIPLSQEVPFYFDPAKNLLLSIWLDSGTTMTYCYFMGSFPNVVHNFRMGGSASNNNVLSKDNVMYDFGFDLYGPTGVEDLSNLQDVKVYPNPGKEKFTVSFATQKAVSGYAIVIRDVTGKELQHQSYGAAGSGRISQTVDTRNLPPGMYLLELQAGEEKMIKKLVVQ